MMSDDGTPQERKFAAVARDKALSFFAANPTVKIAAGRFGVEYRDGMPFLSDNSSAEPCACLLTPMLLLTPAGNINEALEAIKNLYELDDVSFLMCLAFGWDGSPKTARRLRWPYAVGSAVRLEIEAMRVGGK